MNPLSVELFSTCPPFHGLDGETYIRKVVEVARWSEAAGCTGILVYTDNSQLDAWLVSHLIVQNTKTLCPLVAIQPVYAHPYSVAKLVTSFGHLYRRRLYLNMVAGGFKNDLAALDDTTPHNRRYDRLVEYTTIIARLLQGASTVSYEGEFYKVDKLKLTPPLPPPLFPGIFISGSSETGLAAAKALGATAVKYPRPSGEEEAPLDGTPVGIRVGVIARADAAEAWATARVRFPEDRRGQLTHQLAMKASDSVWHQQLSRMGAAAEESPYWLVPFENYKTMCPYLVGSYEQVAVELGRYLALGCRSFILDIPPSAEELGHTNIAFGRALEAVAR